jgi:hypothetical protein
VQIINGKRIGIIYVRFPWVGKVHYRHPLAIIPRISDELESDAHEAFGWFAVALEGLFWDGMEYNELV